MTETIYYVAFGVVIALAIFWLAAMWIKAPREGKWPKWRR